MLFPRVFLVSATLVAVTAIADEPAGATPAVPEKPAATVTDAPVNPPKKISEKDREISPAEIDALLARLAQMRGGLDAEARRAIAEALRALTPAATENAKALALYVDSVKVVDYDKPEKTSLTADKPERTSKGDKSGNDFDVWRKQNENRLHDPGFASVLRIRYRYLKLCLECDTEEKAAAALPALLTLQSDAIAAYAAAGAYASGLRDDVTADPVATRFKISKFKPEGWPGAALDLGAHFGRAVKTALETDPTAVPAVWEARLKLERSLAEATDKAALLQKRKQEQAARRGNTGRGNHSSGRGGDTSGSGDDAKTVTDFENLRLPRLLWRMAGDLMSAGLHRRAFEAMFNVIIKYPKHPDVGDWVDRMTELARTLKEGGDPGSVAPKTAGAKTGTGSKVVGERAKR